MNINEFKNPGAMFRPAPFWGWNDKLVPEELCRQINEIAQKGWGGFFIHSRVGLITDYLSDEWMEYVKLCISEAAKTGISAWLYDEDKWPSGYAGGKVSRLDESYRVRALILIQKSDMLSNDTVLKEINWNNTEFIICIRVASMGDDWFNGACYVDLMNPNAVKAFIDSTHEKYKAVVGDYFGKEIPGVFTDEPCYLNENNWPMPAVPWSDFLPDFFYKEKKYHIKDHVEELFFDVGDYKKIRFDFYDCVTRLFKESFTKQYYKWCSDNNLILTGHFMAEEQMAYQTQWIGAAMPHYELMHWPGIDKLCRRIDEIVTVKQLTSVTDQLGKQRAFCEVFGAIGQDVSFLQRKWITDWEAALGINFVNPHLSLYSMRGERKRDFPANLFYQQPWWDDESGFADYTARLNYALLQGQREVDVLVIHPISSVWSTYSPIYKINDTNPNDNDYDRAFHKLSTALAEHQIDFHYGDEMLMENNACVENGKLKIGKMTYSTIIVPPCNTLRASTLKLLEEFLIQAGKERLIFIKEIPSRIDGKKTSITICKQSTCVLNVKEAVALVEGMYPERVRAVDVLTGNTASSILTHVRLDKDKRIIFMCNKNKEREVDAQVFIPGSGPLCFLDLSTGCKYSATFKQEDKYRVLNILFHPAGSLLLIEDESSEEAPKHMHTGISTIQEHVSEHIIKDFKVELLEDNVLPLENVSLWLDGKCVSKGVHISQIWHKHFYPAPEGTTFKAEYIFYSKSDFNGCYAVIELAENLERITFNNEKVEPLKHADTEVSLDKRSWKDINFTKVPVNIKQGQNILVIEGKKYNNITNPGCHVAVKDFKHYRSTEVEVVYIIGDFKVLNDDNAVFTLDKKDDNVCSGDIVQDGYPFYAGRVRFTASFECNVKLPNWLKLTDVKASSIRIRLNGKNLGTIYWRPYIIDVSSAIRKGKNTLEIEASTTLFNLMGPNWISGILNDTGISPHSFIDPARLTSHYTLIPFGIGNAFLCD